MFQIGKAVLYDMWGVCIIEAVEQQKTPEGLQDYLVLRPFYHNSAKLYLPNTQEVLNKILRPVISRDEIEILLKTLKGHPTLLDRTAQGAVAVYSGHPVFRGPQGNIGDDSYAVYQKARAATKGKTPPNDGRAGSERW